jgi:hypothetical protein
MSVLKEKIVRTSKGFPAIWEEGGGMTRTGYCYLICGENGEKITPVYTRSNGQLSCGQHALFILREGVHVIVVSRTHEEYQQKCFQYKNNEFIEVEPNEKLEEAFEVAREKTRYYHCKVPLYFLPKEVKHEEVLESSLVSSN